MLLTFYDFNRRCFLNSFITYFWTPSCHLHVPDPRLAQRRLRRVPLIFFRPRLRSFLTMVVFFQLYKNCIVFVLCSRMLVHHQSFVEPIGPSSFFKHCVSTFIPFATTLFSSLGFSEIHEISRMLFFFYTGILSCRWWSFFSFIKVAQLLYSVLECLK